MDKSIKNRILSIVMLLGVSMIWGFAFSAQAAVTGSIGANAFTGMRFTLGALVVLPVALIAEGKNRDKQRDLRIVLYGLISGTAMFLACITQQIGIEITQSAGKSSFMTAFYTVLVPIASSVIYRQKKPLNIWLGAIIAMVGLFLLSVTEALTIGLGELCLLLSAFFWTIQIMLVDLAAQKDVQPLKFSVTQFFTCGIMGLILGLIYEPSSFTLEAIRGGLGPLLYTGIMSVGIAFTLQTFAQKRSDPSTAAIIFSMESVFGTLGGAIFLHEVMSKRAYIGCFVMLAGLVLSQLDMQAIAGSIKRKNKEKT